MSLLIRCCFLIISLVAFSCSAQAGHKHKHKSHKDHAVQISELARYLRETPPPEWMLEQIHADLAPFYESGVSVDAMNQLMQQDLKEGSPKLLARYKIVNNQIDVNFISIPPRYELVTEALKKLADAVQLPELDFIVTMHDALDHCESPAPVFAFAKNPKCAPTVVLIPDFEALGGREIAYENGRKQLVRAVEEGNAKHPWTKKVNKAIWRGSRTGGLFTLDNFLQFPRSMAITFSLIHPELLDARFSTFAQEGGDLKRAFPKYFGDTLCTQDQIKYKYQLIIDGNSCAYSGSFWRLLSNCVTLKQSSDSIQWYYRALHPYVHFIPIKSDMSDFAEKIEWAKEHDSEAEQISIRAQAFVNENLSDPRIMQYLYHLLIEYAKLPFYP